MKTIRLFKVEKEGISKERVLCIKPVLPRPKGLQEAMDKKYRIFDRSGYDPFNNNLVIYHPISLAVKATHDAFDWNENINFMMHRHITQNWNTLEDGEIDGVKITEFNNFKHTVKYFQVRDRGTNMPCMCIKFNTHFEMDIAREPIFCHFLEIQEGNFNSKAWALASIYPRTKETSHKYIDTNWDNLKNGDVIDVEYILGERDTLKEFD